MNKIIKTTSLALASALLLTACSLDNYKQPNASLCGTILDAKTGEPIQQDINTSNGSRIDLVELGYANPTTRYLNFKSDGTFRENNMFSGKYSISFTQANFTVTESSQTLTDVAVKGETNLTFKGIPYCRVNLDTFYFSKAKQKIFGKVRVETTTSDVLKKIGVFCDTNPNASLSMNTFGDLAPVYDINCVFPSDSVFNLSMEISGLQDGRDYYFRVGALSGAEGAKYNYAPVVKIKIVKGEIQVPKQKGVYIDDCNSKESWRSDYADVLLDESEGGYLTGIGAIYIDSEGATVKDTDSTLFEKMLSKRDCNKIPRDGAVLHMNIYVKDPSKIPASSKGEIEIASGAAGHDDQELHWTFAQMGTLVKGWNSVSLPVKDAVAVGGDINWTAINYVRLHNVDIDEGFYFKLDEIRMFYPTQVNTCDSADEFSGSSSSVSTDNENFREGTGSVKTSVDAGGDVNFKLQMATPVAVSEIINASNAYLQFYVWVEDNSIQDVSEVTATIGSSSSNCITVDATTEAYTWEAGWNKVNVKLNGGTKKGTIDFNNLSYFELNINGVPNAGTINLDDINVFKSGYEPVEN